MPNTNAQLNNIIKQLSRVVGGSSRIAHSYASIPQKVDFVNKQANKLKFLDALGGGSELGSLFSATSFTSNSDFTPTGNLTAVPSGGGLQISTPTQGVYTQRLLLNSQITDLPYWNITATFSLTVGTSSAIAIGTSSINTGDKFDLLGSINATSTTAGIFIDTGINGSFGNQATSSGMTIATGHIVTLSLTRQEEIVTLVAKNANNGTTLSTRFTFLSTSGAILPNVSQFALYSFGNTNTLLDLSISSSLPSDMPSLLVGDSKVVGYYGASFTANIAGQLRVLGYNTTQLAGGSEMTSDVLNRIAEVISLSPTVVGLAIGSNDIRAGISSEVWQANYSSIVSQLESAGITVVHILPPKETAINVDPLYNYVNNTYSNNKIDAYTGFNTGTMLNGDGIHPNALGMNFIVQQINNSGLIPK